MYLLTSRSISKRIGRKGRFFQKIKIYKKQNLPNEKNWEFRQCNYNKGETYIFLKFNIYSTISYQVYLILIIIHIYVYNYYIMLFKRIGRKGRFFQKIKIYKKQNLHNEKSWEFGNVITIKEKHISFKI